MKNKKSLLSVLLAAVLLCACVAGMLIFGAGAAGEAIAVYYVDNNSEGTASDPDFTQVGEDQIPTFKSISDATAYAKAKENGWEDNEELNIQLLSDVSIAMDTNRVFVSYAVNRIERNDNSSLPITISSADVENKNTITFVPLVEGEEIGQIQFVNDYTLLDVNLYASAKAVFYVCDKLELCNVQFDANVASSIFASNDTFDDYGLTDSNLLKRLDENGEITTELVFSGSTTVTSSCNIYGLCSYAEGENETTGNEHFPASVTFDESGKTLTREMFNSAITVKGTATLAGVDGMNVSNGRGDSTLNILDTASITGNIFGINGGRTLNSGASINFNIHGGTITSIFCCYTGGNKDGILIQSGASINVDVKNATVSGNIHCAVNQNYGPETTGGGNIVLEEKAEFNVTIGEGSTVTTVYGPNASSDSYVTRYPVICGEINLELNGGTVTNVYAIGRNTRLKKDAKANVTVNGATVSNVYGVYSNGVVEGGAEIKLTLNKGTIKTLFNLAQADTTARIEKDAKISAYLNGGTYTTSSGRLLYDRETVDEDGDGNPDKNSKGETIYVAGGGFQFESGSKIYVEYNGTTVPSSCYPFYYVILHADIEILVTQFVQTGSSSLARFLNATTLYGDFTITADTTVDGWGGSSENAKRTDSTGKKVDKKIETGTFHPGWSSYVYGKGTVNIDGGANSTFSCGTLYGVGAQIVENNIRNAKVTTQLEALRGGLASSTAATAETGVQSITNNLYNVEAAIFTGSGNNTNNSYIFGDTENTIENCVIGTYYGGGRSKSDTRKNVTNIFRGANTISSSLYLGSYGGTIEALSSTISGTLNLGESAKFYTHGSKAVKNGNTLIFYNLTNFDEVYAKLTQSSGTITGDKTIILKNLTANNAVAPLTGYELVLGDNTTFGGAVTGTTVTLGEDGKDTAITLQGAGSIAATSVLGNVTVTKADAWGTFDTVYVTAPADAAGKITVVNSEATTGFPVILKNGGYELRGIFGMQAQLFVETTTMLRVYFDKLHYDAFVGKESSLAYAFEMEGIEEALLSGTEVSSPVPLADGREYYYVELRAVGAGSFAGKITATFNEGAVLEISILDICELGIESATDPNTKEVKLFKALYDYGAAACKMDLQYTGDLSFVSDGLDTDITDNFEKGENPPVAFNGVTLLMGDAIGIRYRFNPGATIDAKNFKLVIGGKTFNAESGMFLVDENGYLAFFVKAESLASKLNVTIMYGDSVCMTMTDLSVKDLITLFNDTDKATATKNFIQATQDYLAA